eukprot:symbB.v1.2.018058.t1/scaffold1398.1/size121478/1
MLQLLRLRKQGRWMSRIFKPCKNTVQRAGLQQLLYQEDALLNCTRLHATLAARRRAAHDRAAEVRQALADRADRRALDTRQAAARARRPLEDAIAEATAEIATLQQQLPGEVQRLEEVEAAKLEEEAKDNFIEASGRFAPIGACAHHATSAAIRQKLQDLQHRHATMVHALETKHSEKSEAEIERQKQAETLALLHFEQKEVNEAKREKVQQVEQFRFSLWDVEQKITDITEERSVKLRRAETQLQELTRQHSVKMADMKSEKLRELHAIRNSSRSLVKSIAEELEGQELNQALRVHGDLERKSAELLQTASKQLSQLLSLAYCPLVILRACCNYKLLSEDIVKCFIFTADGHWVSKRMDEAMFLDKFGDSGSIGEDHDAVPGNPWETNKTVEWSDEWTSDLRNKVTYLGGDYYIKSCSGAPLHWRNGEPNGDLLSSNGRTLTETDFPLEVIFECQASRKFREVDERVRGEKDEVAWKMYGRHEKGCLPGDRFLAAFPRIVETLFCDVQSELKALYDRQAQLREPKSLKLWRKIERASKLNTPAAIVEAMEQAIQDFQVPPEREDRVLDQTRIRLKRIVAEAEENIRKMLAESSSTPSIDAVSSRFKHDFGPVASVVEEEIKVARIRRVQFLEMELETRWSRPFAGPLPPHSRAARRYEVELGKKNPKVIAFVTEESRHAATLEANFEVELSELRAKVRELTKKRMEARARSLIQDFDEKLADAAAQVQEAPKTKP